MVHPDNGILFRAKEKWAIKSWRQGGNLNAYQWVKEANLKWLHTVWFQLYDILEKAKPWGQSKDQWLPEAAGRRGWTGRAWRSFGEVKLFCMMLRWWIHVFIHLSKPTECPTPRVNPNVNYGLWVIMMCQYRFISYNKCTAVVAMSAGRGCAFWGTGNMWELSVLSAQFCCEPKTAR